MSAVHQGLTGLGRAPTQLALDQDVPVLRQLLAAGSDLLGWETMVIWECPLKNIEEVRGRVISFLDGQ